MEDPLTVECPHCNCLILIEKLNCCIFRHAIMKDTGKQIDPHTNKETCDSLFNNGLIHGCGKPFKIIVLNDKMIVEVCDYI